MVTNDAAPGELHALKKNEKPPSGETVTYKSDFFNFKNIKVTPEPIQMVRK
jgi:hypothetical protein